MFFVSHAHLKKVLALVMAFAMAFTMMASAAYTDQADITATEAVDTLAALNVMTGDPNGAFRPNDTVTRAEMCRMIYTIRSGGKDDASSFAGMKTTFTDVKDDAWYAGYVKYCQSVGIVSGKSATTFDPSAKVTGVEAALMCLRVMGYNPTKANIGGSTWSMTTIGLATEAGLLDDVDCTITSALPRQYAAQIMFNMIDANTVKWSDDEDGYSSTTATGTKYETVGHKYMGLNKTVATLTNVAKTDGKDTYELTLDEDTVNEIDSDKPYVFAFKDVAKDYNALKYNTVKVLYKKSNEVYGVFATTDNTSNTGVLANLKVDGEKVKLDGVKYSIAKNGGTVYVDGVAEEKTGIYNWVKANAEGNKTYEKGCKVELLATDGTSKVSILNVTTYDIEKVSYVGKDYLTAGSKRSDEDYNYSSSIKKDDYVMISAADNYSDGKGLIEKAEVVEGKIDSTKTNSSSKINKVQINGAWYSTNVATTGDSALKLGSTVKLILVNGYIYEIDKVTTAASDIALLVEAGKGNGVSSKWQARLIFADGSDKVVDIDKTWDDKGEKEVEQAIDDTPTLVTYDVSKNVYTLTKITAADAAGYDEYVEVTAATVDGSVTGTGLSGKMYFESTGVVFVRQDAGKSNDDPEFKVVTGKTAAKWDLKDALKGKLSVKAVADNSNKNLYAQVAVVDFGANKTSGSSDKTYAVALDASYTSKQGGTTYTMVKAWNGTEETTYKYEGTKTIAAGDIFEYSTDSEDTVDIDVVATYKSDKAKVKSYDEGTGDIVLEGVTVKSDSKVDSKDTVVLYVDADAGEGVGDGEIRQANKYNDSSDKDVENVAVFSEDGEDYITVIVVDVNNDYTAW